MKKNNPFTLTFGRQPAEYINRYENTYAIISTFEADNPVSQAYLIEGIRGSGKTVLMTKVEHELAGKGDWVTVDLNATCELLSDLAMRLGNEQKKPSAKLKSGFSVTIGGFGVGINGEETQNDIAVIEGFLSSAQKKKKKVLITIDEVCHDSNMKRFASEFQLLVRKNYPVYLLMTGLYENINALQNDPALTFLLRTPKITLEPLSINQITKQYGKTLAVDEKTARSLAGITKGYAFAFQALGLLYFEQGKNMPLDDILSTLDDMLDDFVYKKIWSSLTDQEKRIMQILDDSPMKVKTICDTLGMQASTFSKYREKLIKKGILETTGHGYVACVLPRFSNVIASYAP